MKITFTYIILVSIVCNFEPVFGQLNLGIHGGINISSLTPQLANSDSEGEGYRYSYSKSLSGYYLGLFTGLKLDRYLNLLIDCSYTKDGYQTYSENYADGQTYVHRSLNDIYMHFVEPQAIVEYGLPIGTGRMILGAGLNMTIPVSGEQKLQYTFQRYYATPAIDTTVYNNNFSKKISVGIVGMLRYEFNFGLFFEILYKYQLKAQPYYILDTKEVSSSLNLSVFELGTGFTFQFKKKGE